MFRTSRHSKSLLEVIKNYLQAYQTFWGFYNFRKMFRTLSSGTPGVFQKSYKNIYKLARHSEASKTSKKYSGAPGTPGVFQKSYKSIYKLARLSEASTTSKKMFRTSRHSRSLLEVIQKYLQACQIL